MIRSWLLALVLPFAPALHAQVQVENPDVGAAGVGENGETEEARYMAEKRRAMKESGDLPSKEVEDFSKLTPEERLARSVVHGAGSFCTFETSLEPRRLLPGQTGTLTVMMILRGDAVLPAPPAVSLRSPTQQDPFSLGAIQFREPKAGALHAAFRGRPVYEELAVFDLPVTVAATAKLGAKHHIGIDLQFDLYSGSTGQPIGRFTDRTQREVEIGAAPGRVVVTAEVAAATSGSAPPVAKEPVPSDAVPTPNGDQFTGGNALPVADGAPAPVQPEARTEAPPAEEFGPMPFLILGGVLALVVALAVILRRR